MIRFLNADVVIAHRSCCHCINMIRIVETIVIVVMACRGNETGYLVQMIKFCNLDKSAFA